MNEVTKIHLGRQAFDISAAAHKVLREYLDAISRQVGDKDVVEEVELRMAELLTEHGVKDEKVILMKDVDYLKKQLGDPKDFKEDEDGMIAASVGSSGGKRLFRDTDNQIIAGVAAGLANYFGLDVWLIRILFVIGTFAWGGSILIYIVLWLLVPPAKTSSEKLQMMGKPVTVGSLKEVVERADVKGAARRANSSIAEVVNGVFSFIVKLIGVGLVIVGLVLILGLLAAGFYLIFHGNFVQDNLFPIGFKEHLLVYIGFAVAGLISLFVVLVGMAVFRRRWPIRTWLTGALIGLICIGLVAGGALAADAAPRVRDRYNSHFRTVVKNVQPFTTVNEIGPATVDSQFANKYYVAIKYYDKSDPSKIKLSVKNGTLLVDASMYQWDRHCSSLCIPNHFDLRITVYSPNPPPIQYPEPSIAPLKVYPGPVNYYSQ